jgi:hypothetical protein
LYNTCNVYNHHENNFNNMKNANSFIIAYNVDNKCKYYIKLKLTKLLKQNKIGHLKIILKKF